MRVYFKVSFCEKLIIIFMVGFIFIHPPSSRRYAGTTADVAWLCPWGFIQASAEEMVRPAATRIVISTSGPVEFSAHWLDNPYRLVVEFESRNVLSKLGQEVVVNQGPIKKITSSYFTGEPPNTLKTLVFELSEKVPYKIQQEGNHLLLDLQAPLETEGFSIYAKGREVTVTEQVTNVSEPPTVVDVTDRQVQGTESQLPLENNGKEVNAARGTDIQIIDSVKPQPEAVDKSLKDNPKGKIESRVVSMGYYAFQKSGAGLLLFSGVMLISLCGFLVRRKYKVSITKNMTERIRELELQLEGKNKILEQAEIIRKTIEKTSIEKEKEYEQIKLELQDKNRLFQQEETIRKEKEEALSETTKEYHKLQEASETLKDVLVKKGLAKELSSPGEKGELWISGKSSEKRQLPRLDLSRDYNRTIILRIESPDKSKSIKSFANNICLGGLCFETRRDFKEKEAINLRLFFFGDKVPIIKIKTEIIWKKTVLPVNYYGVSFVSIEEKDKANLSQYIESKITKG